MARKNGSKPSGEQIDLLLPPAALHQRHQYISRDLIEVDPDQPRKDLDAELRDAIARTGILEPIIVRPHPTKMGLFMIVNGERRWRGAEGVQHRIPCIVREDQSNEQDRLITQLVANTGKPLEPAEEARAFARLVELSGKSVTEVSEMIGRPRSTIGDRLSLLEIGPWLGLVEAGEISVSHVVRVIVPLRGVPDEYHRKAIDTIRKDHRWKKNGIALDVFERIVDGAYRSFMYPLQKSKARYGSGSSRPTFDTKDHNKECDCGRIRFKYDYNGKRDCCGNPGWWQSRHRKGSASKTKKKSGRAATPTETGPRSPKYYLPEGTPTVKSPEWADPPKGMVALTDTTGRWNTRELECDPRGVDVGAVSLVATRSGHKILAAKTAGPLAAARESWAQRWAARAKELARPLTDPKGQRAKYVVEGPGARALLPMLLLRDEDSRGEYFWLARAVGISVPQSFLSEASWEIKVPAIEKWIESVDDAQVSLLLTGMAMVEMDAVKSPVNQLLAEQKRVEDAIAKVTPPWLKAPAKKAPKEPQAKKKTGKARTVPKKAAPKAVTKKAKRTPSPAFSEKLIPSTHLASVIGTGPFTRVDITKKLWAYIKANKLQDAKERRMVNADHLLRPLFGGKDRVSMFDMVKLVNGHLTALGGGAAALFNSKPKKPKGNGAAQADQEDDGPPPKLSREDQMDLIDAARGEQEEDDADELAGVTEE